MRKHYERPFGPEVDLDNPETYKHLPQTIEELNDRMLKNIGYATCYMDYWHPDIFLKEKGEPDFSRHWSENEINMGWPDSIINSGYYQRQRVYKLIEDFTSNRRENWHNLQWFLEQVYMFEDETENMC